ncbi:MAG: ATP-binding protein [Candidatus Omnitrophota bacterium]|nr:ATP-binding protein [Candidatus Omnitrophota bacterium]
MADQEKEIQGLKEDLLKANQEIDKLSRIKSDFISVISHELRTPLTSIKESVSLILDEVTGPLSEEQKKFLTIAKNNIDRLAKLITDILDLSKLEAGRIHMHKKKADINNIIKDVYAATKISVEHKKIEFSLSLEESIEPTWVDPDRIGRVLKNLISNAVKFNRDNGRIKISSSKEHIKERDFVRITVEDNGIGIPQEEMENLFRNFSPLDTSMTRRHNGAGLGLAISKGIVELHGGDIWVISEPDTGSKFIFTIPIYKKHEEFNFLIEEAFERSKYNDAKLCLIVFEIKGSQNKSERALLEIEDIIEKTMRGPEDKITRCRNGGCIVIIARTDRLGAMAIVRRLKGSVKIPLVYGLSVFPEECSDKDELLKKAEEDLKSGRNLVVS